jgi:5-methylcytosine-specific restriction endonuclease McrA
LAKFYTCNKCKEDFPAKNVEVNHIIPVVPVNGFDSWDGVISRLFCEEDGLEVVCKPCHKLITKEENLERKVNAKSKSS